MNDIDPIFICLKCNELADDPYECVRCNQCYCKNCLINLSNYCVSCKQTTNFNISKIGKKIIDQLIVPCKYCGDKYKNEEKSMHYSKCTRIKISCKYPECRFQGEKNAFLEHVYVYHMNELYSYFSLSSNVKNQDFLNFHNQGIIVWQNELKVQKRPGGQNKKYLISSLNKFKKAKIVVKFDCQDYNFCMIGFSKDQYNGDNLYLGGETGLGTWGVAGNGVIGEEKKWNKNFESVFSFKGDEIMLNFDNGIIRFQINNKKNNYAYDLKEQEVYLSATLYHADSTITIISDFEY